jgi:peptidoglycan/LPS O-acetylase OafA/YrhL
MELFFLIVLLLLLGALVSVIARRRKPFELKNFDRDRSLSLKAFLAFLIVLHHSSQPLCKNGETFFFQFWFWGPAIVGLFFFLTGYGLLKSLKSKEGYMKTFMRKRFLKILPPYIIAIVIYQCYIACTGNFDFGILVSDFMKGCPPIPNSWYIVAIILFYLLFYFVFRFIRSIGVSLVLMWLLSIAYMVIIKYIGWGDWWWISTLALNVGMTYSYFEPSIKEKIGKHPLLSCIVAIALLAALFAFTYFDLAKNFISGFPSYSLAFWLLPLFVIFAIYYIGMPQGRLFMFLGNISYELYIVHGAFVWLMPYSGSNFLFLFCIYAVSILVAIGLHKICEPIVRNN